jgi:DNA-directed RNA polymerase subunit RPC12/RpoP
MNERLSITCAACSKRFRELPSKIKAGNTLACPNCPVSITIDSESTNASVRKALSMARKLRLQSAVG